MVSSKKLVEMAKKWHHPARTGDGSSTTNTSKGRVTLYTLDETRFLVPVSYLSSDIFRQLLAMAEELIGLPIDRAITLPCDAVFMQSVLSILQKRKASKDVQRDLLNFISTSRCSSSPISQESYENQNQMLCGF